MLDESEDQENPERMAECIQALIDLLSQEILCFDMNHIRGEDIVNGNADHCINLLQILQQISHANMMAAVEGEGEDESPDRSSAQQRDSSAAMAQEGRDSAPDGAQSSSMKKSQGERDNVEGNSGLFDMDGPQSAQQDKQQFLDNLDEDVMADVQVEQAVSGLSANKVGDVIGQQLDIEFDDDIKENIHDAADYRRSGEDASDSEQAVNLKEQIGQAQGSSAQKYQVDGIELEDDEEEQDDDDDDDIIDPNQVELMVAPNGQQYLDLDGDMEVVDEMRDLNRQTDNMADFPHQFSVEDEGVDLNEQQRPMQQFDGQVDEYGQEVMVTAEEAQQLQHAIQQERGDDDGDGGEEMSELEELHPQIIEAGKQLGLDEESMRLLQRQLMAEGAGEEGEEEEQDMDESERDGVAANQLDNDDEDKDAAELAEMLERVDNQKQPNKEDDEEFRQILRGGQEIEEGPDENHYGLEADHDNEDGDEEVVEELEDVEYMLNQHQRGDEVGDQSGARNSNDIEQEMAEQLQMINSQESQQQYAQQQQEGHLREDASEAEGEGEDEDEEDELIDIDHLADNEKVVLWHYLSEEYQKNPDQLPMPRDIVEQFLADNAELVQRLSAAQNDDQDDGDAGEHMGEEDGEFDYEADEVGAKMAAPPAGAIDSNEVIVEGAGDDDEDLQAMVLKAGSSPSREQQMYVNENGEYVVKDQDDGDDGEDDQQEYQDEGEGEQLMYGDEEMDQAEQEQLMQMQIQQQQLQAEGYGDEQEVEDIAEGDAHDEEDEEDEQQQVQMLDPQYGMQVASDNQSPSQEIPADGAISYEQLEMLMRNNMLTPEQQYMLEQQLIAQNQQLQMQQNMLPPGYGAHQLQQPRRSSGNRKKKSAASTRQGKPPMSSFGGQSKGSVAGLSQRAQRPLTAAANKKYRRSKFAGNTISHEEDMVGGIPRTAKRAMDFGLIPGATSGSAARAKGSSQGKKRPGTAKPRRAFALGTKAVKRHSNYNIAVPGPISSTPSHRLRSAKHGALAVQKHAIVPQQSQMFTSFGLPTYGAGQSLSHRKVSGSNSRKKQYSQLYGSNRQPGSASAANRLKKRPPVPSQGNGTGGTARRKKKAMMLGDLRGPSVQVQQDGSLLAMPALSDDYLNQLNEEQLQKLLEQQKMLMALQQQANEEQVAQQEVVQMEGHEGMDDQVVDDEGQQEQQELLQQQEDQLGAHGQQVEYVQDDELEYDQQQQLEQQVLAQQQLLLQHQAQRYSQKPRQAQALRSRGRPRGAPLAQSAKVGLGGAAAVVTAARIPSAGRGRAMRGSSGGSRSAHGSRKRAQKTRSSLNVAASGALAGPLALGTKGQSANYMPASANASSQIFRSQKLAAHIYSTQSDLTNLVSQRKKPTPTMPMRASLKAKKRAQPHQAQGGKVQLAEPAADQQYDIQAQILAQQAQYNQMLQNEQYQLAVQAEKQLESQQHEEVIDEASPDQEEAESQTQQSQLNQQKLLMQQQEAPLGSISNIAEDLSTQQIIELLQQNEHSQAVADQSEVAAENALPEDVQMHLQQVLQDRMLQQQQYLLQQQQMTDQQPGLEGQDSPSKPPRDALKMISGMAIGDRVQSYQNICNILTESVSKAKQRYGNLSEKRRPSRSQSPQHNVAQYSAGGLEEDDKIIKQKRQFEDLLKQYQHDVKRQENKRMMNLKRQERIARRDDKIRELRQKRFEDEMLNQQRSQIVKRGAQQVRLQKKVMRLAADFEKSKVLDDRKRARETDQYKMKSKKQMVETIENYFKDRISMLKDRIDQEKFDRRLAGDAQKKAMATMKRELDDQKRKEVQRYIQLLQQEDEQFDVENLNLGRLEGEIVKLYKGKGQF